MQFTAAQIALMVDGQVDGNPAEIVFNFGKIEEASTGHLSFLANPKYEEFLYNTNASVILVNESLVVKEAIKATLIRVPNAYVAFATLLKKYQELKTQNITGIEQPSFIATNAVVGKDTYIGAFTYVSDGAIIGNNTKIFPNSFIGKNVTVGDNCMLHAGVKIYHDCVIGNNVTVHAGTAIGSDGFGFAPQADGTYQKVPQIGNVIIEDTVEIGANACIDRATLGSTIIRSGTKLDNLIQIAHNVEIGNHSVIAAQVGISGSTKIGTGVMIGGQAGIVGHISIADGSKVNAQSGVSKSIKNANSSVTGTPATEFTSALRSQAMLRNLPEMEKRVQALENLVIKLLADKK